MAAYPAGYEFEDEDENDYMNDYSGHEGSRDWADSGLQDQDGAGDPAGDEEDCPDVGRLELDLAELLRYGNLDELRTWLKRARKSKACPQQFLAGNQSDQAGEDPGDLWWSGPVSVACSVANLDGLKFLVQEFGVSILGREIGGSASHVTPPLHAVCGAPAWRRGDPAIEDGFLSCAAFLVDECGVDVNAADSQMFTPLMLASKEGHLKIVEFLIDRGAKIDAMDTFRWTALCFAADRGHGHVMRRLIDLGANVNTVTCQGLSPLEIVPRYGGDGVDYSLYHISVARRKDRESEEKAAAEGKTLKIYGDLETLLMGIKGGQKYIQNFKQHRVDLFQFLCLSEDDLKEIGVDSVGVRKSILQALSELSKQEWTKSSLPTIKLKDKQKGIYFTCPESVVMLENISEHLQFVNANVRFLAKNIRDRPAILHLGQDVCNAHDLLKSINRSLKATNVLHQRLLELKDQVEPKASQETYKPADRFQGKPKSWKNMVSLTAVVSVVALVICVRTRISGKL